jgi:hypothetical protein
MLGQFDQRPRVISTGFQLVLGFSAHLKAKIPFCKAGKRVWQVYEYIAGMEVFWHSNISI